MAEKWCTPTSETFPWRKSLTAYKQQLNNTTPVRKKTVIRKDQRRQGEIKAAIAAEQWFSSNILQWEWDPLFRMARPFILQVSKKATFNYPPSHTSRLECWIGLDPYGSPRSQLSWVVCKPYMISPDLFSHNAKNNKKPNKTNQSHKILPQHTWARASSYRRNPEETAFAPLEDRDVHEAFRATSSGESPEVTAFVLLAVWGQSLL